MPVYLLGSCRSRLPSVQRDGSLLLLDVDCHEEPPAEPGALAVDNPVTELTGHGRINSCASFQQNIPGDVDIYIDIDSCFCELFMNHLW